MTEYRIVSERNSKGDIKHDYFVGSERDNSLKEIYRCKIIAKAHKEVLKIEGIKKLETILK